MILHSDLSRWVGHSFPVRRYAYSDRDTMIYALSIGLGQDPANQEERAFVCDPGLRAIPSQATVISWDDSWLPEIGLDLTKVVHGEQRITLHRLLPVAADILATVRIVAVFDKGPEKGAVLYVETRIQDARDGSEMVTLNSTVFARGNGGFGGTAGNPPALTPVPERAPDQTLSYPTSRNQAYLYRLNGDRNPLHVDPDFAARAGFPQPILHGLCSYAMATRAVVCGPCGHDPSRLAHIEARFTAPVFPGETLVTEFWDKPNGVAFRTRVPERDVIVLDRGTAILRP